VRSEPRGGLGGFAVSQSAPERLVGVFESAPLLVLALAAGVGTAGGAWVLRRRG
jgi:hypothetical protein